MIFYLCNFLLVTPIKRAILQRFCYKSDSYAIKIPAFSCLFIHLQQSRSADGQVVQHRQPAVEQPGNYINCITQSRSGIILIGSNQNVQAFDGARFHDFDLTGADGKQVNTYINYITESSEGYLLACTSGYGIFRLDENSSTGTFDSTLTADNLYVRFLLEDTFGRHWIVTETDGLVLAEGQRRTAFFTKATYGSAPTMACAASIPHVK